MSLSLLERLPEPNIELPAHPELDGWQRNWMKKFVLETDPFKREAPYMRRGSDKRKAP
jgi:hypothetical protein